MNIVHIKYLYMTEDVKNFCLPTVLEEVPHQSSNCIGYFLPEDSKSPNKMLSSGIYIIKDCISKTITFSYKAPISSTELILRPKDSTHVERLENFNAYYKIVKDDSWEYTYSWTGTEWDECSTMSMADTVLEAL